MSPPTPSLPQLLRNLLLFYLGILILPIRSISERLMPAFLTPSFAGTPVSSSETSGKAECTICLCSISKGEKTSDLRCHHLFHKFCLDRWLEHQGRTCPICREHLYSGKEAKRGIEVVHGEVGTVIISPFGDPVPEESWWIR